MNTEKATAESIEDDRLRASDHLRRDVRELEIRRELGELARV
jgi:hypothetical protein